MRALALLAALALPLSAFADRHPVQTMDGRQDGARLALRASEGQLLVEAASPAARFGVRRGDRILRVNDTPVRQVDHLSEALRQAASPTAYLLLRRDGRTLTVPVAVATWKAVLAPPPPAPPPPPR